MVALAPVGTFTESKAETSLLRIKRNPCFTSPDSAMPVAVYSAETEPQTSLHHFFCIPFQRGWQLPTSARKAQRTDSLIFVRRYPDFRLRMFSITFHRNARSPKVNLNCPPARSGLKWRSNRFLIAPDSAEATLKFRTAEWRRFETLPTNTENSGFQKLPFNRDQCLTIFTRTFHPKAIVLRQNGQDFRQPEIECRALCQVIL